MRSSPENALGHRRLRGGTRGGEREVVITQELPVKACVVGENLAWETRAKTK